MDWIDMAQDTDWLQAVANAVLFHKMWRVSWLGEDMLASEEGLSLVELLSCVLCRNQVIQCCSNKHWNFEPWHFLHIYITIKGKSNPITGLDKPWGFQEVVASRFQDHQHMKLLSLSALCTGRHYPPGNIPDRGWVNSRAVVRPEGCQWKIPMTPSEVEPTTSQLVALCSYFWCLQWFSYKITKRLCKTCNSYFLWLRFIPNMTCSISLYNTELIACTRAVLFCT